MKAIEEYNSVVAEAYRKLRESRVLAEEMPVGRVQLVHIDRIQANDYNPNSVANQEMRLLYVSIEQDGYTQPVVTVFEEEIQKYIIVDGFHRYSIMRANEDIYESTGGYLPVVVIDKPIADRVASTVRHNRARGKHSVTGMSSLVFKMLEEGESDAVICNKLGMEAEELQRLKYVTGYAKLYEDHEYTDAVVTASQVKHKKRYAQDHPEEKVDVRI